MSFGQTNSTITRWWQATEQEKTIHGGIVLSDETGLVIQPEHKIWFEITQDENRQVVGDSFSKVALAIGDYLETIREGDIIEIQLKPIGYESALPPKKWRITQLKQLYGFQRVNFRIRRMELSLTEEI